MLGRLSVIGWVMADQNVESGVTARRWVRWLRGNGLWCAAFCPDHTASRIRASNRLHTDGVVILTTRRDMSRDSDLWDWHRRSRARSSNRGGCLIGKRQSGQLRGGVRGGVALFWGRLRRGCRIRRSRRLLFRHFRAAIALLSTGRRLLFLLLLLLLLLLRRLLLLGVFGSRRRGRRLGRRSRRFSTLLTCFFFLRRCRTHARFL